MPRTYKGNPVLHARAARALDNLRNNSALGILERSAETGDPLILAFADGTQKKAKIVRAEPKRFATEEREHDKLELLFAVDPKAGKKLKKVLRRDEGLARPGTFLSPNPRERLHVSKMVFQRLIDESLLARFLFVDGSVLPCRTRSFGFFEVNVVLKGGGSAVLFRHGLQRIVAGDEVLADIALGFHVQGRPRSTTKTSVGAEAPGG